MQLNVELSSWQGVKRRHKGYFNPYPLAFLRSLLNGGNLPSGSASKSIPLLGQHSLAPLGDAGSFLSLLMPGNLFDTLLALDNNLNGGNPPSGSAVCSSRETRPTQLLHRNGFVSQRVIDKARFVYEDSHTTGEWNMLSNREHFLASKAAVRNASVSPPQLLHRNATSRFFQSQPKTRCVSPNKNFLKLENNSYPFESSQDHELISSTTNKI